MVKRKILSFQNPGQKSKEHRMQHYHNRAGNPWEMSRTLREKEKIQYEGHFCSKRVGP